MYKKNLFSLVAIILFFVACIIQNGTAKIHKDPKKVIYQDVLWYYEYLPSIFIKNDIKMSFIGKNTRWYYHNEERYWSTLLENGNHVNKTTMGLAIIYSPAFLVAHLLAKPLGYDNNGYTVPYAVALIISSMIYVTLGLFLIRRLLLLYYSDLITAISIFIIGVATNLFYYTTAYEAPMSHAYNFFLFACFIYLTKKWFDNPTYKYSILLGIVWGFIALIRPTNALIIIVFILFGITSFKQQLILFLKNYKKIILIVACSFLICLPQFCYWKCVTNHWLFYSYGDNEKFFFNNPHIIQFLVGFRKGWLLYTPTMILSIIGMVFVWKNNRDYFFPILIFMIINIYVLSCWWCWWFGGGFGMRALIETYALLIIPLAALLNAISKSKLFLKIPACLLVIIIVFISCFHHLRYRSHSIHYDSMTKKTYFENFFSLKPNSHFYKILEIPDYEAASKGEDKIKSNDEDK